MDPARPTMRNGGLQGLKTLPGASTLAYARALIFDMVWYRAQFCNAVRKSPTTFACMVQESRPNYPTMALHRL